MSYSKETKKSLWEHLEVVEQERNNLLVIKAELLEYLKECVELLRLQEEHGRPVQSEDVRKEAQQIINKAEGKE